MMDVQQLINKYTEQMTALFNVNVTLTVNENGTITRAKAKGVKPMTLTVQELEAQVNKMNATLLKLLAI